MSKTYTAFKLDVNRNISHKEHLNNIDEVNDWLEKVYGKYARVIIFCDQDNKVRELVDNGLSWEKV